MVSRLQIDQAPGAYYIVYVGDDDAPGWDGKTYARLWCCHRHRTLAAAAECYKTAGIGRDHDPPIMAVTRRGGTRALTPEERIEINRILRDHGFPVLLP